jgi:uncharacterized membrane protein
MRINHLTTLMLATFLFASPLAVSAEAKTNFKCHGTEPYWSLDIKDNAVSLSQMGQQKIVLDHVRSTNTEGMNKDFMRIYRSHMGKDNKSVVILIKDNPEGCTDGMSNKVYGHDAIVILPSKSFVGCCS